MHPIFIDQLYVLFQNYDYLPYRTERTYALSAQSSIDVLPTLPKTAINRLMTAGPHYGVMMLMLAIHGTPSHHTPHPDRLLPQVAAGWEPQSAPVTVKASVDCIQQMIDDVLTNLEMNAISGGCEWLPITV